MKTITRFPLALILLALGFLHETGYAQVGTPHYKFQSRGELRGLLLKNAYNSIALYDLAILSHRRGWLGTAINAGDELLKKNQRGANAQALIAFCIYTGLFARNWNWPIDKAAGDLWKRQMEANLLQSESLKVQSPGIQLMAAVSKANLPTSREFDDALRLFRLTLKRKPDWADAHYWYGRALVRASSQKPKAERFKAYRQSFKIWDQAEKEDKEIYSSLLISRSGLLSELGYPREALAAFETYFRLYPAFEQYLNDVSPGYVDKTRARLKGQIKQ